MIDEIVIIDQTYKYKVEKILDGGVGYVRLMSMLEFSRMPPDSNGIAISDCVDDLSKYPYRTQLAAKTIKYPSWMESFSKACEPWLGLNLQGIVPLLKLIKNGDETLALMPRYAGNLRMLMQSGRHRPIELLKALYPVVTCLSKVHTEHGIVHQAIKPENILFCYHNQKLVFELSDWGIADIQANLLSETSSERMKSLDDFGVLPYLAPERFDNFLSDMRADIFNLGMVFFEISTGSLPYHIGKNVAELIASGEYYKVVENRLSEVSDKKVVRLIRQMLHPEFSKRPQAYGDILELIVAL
jgi:serine/threonine protein kinase